MSYTLAILKPDAVSNPIVLKYISDAIIQNGLKISKGCKLRIDRKQASDLYSVHTSKFFYNRLIRHICSGPVIVMQLTLASDDSIKHGGFLSRIFTKPNINEVPKISNENVIKLWRKILGPSKLFPYSFVEESEFCETDYTNVRQYFAVSDTRNVAHGSDSITELSREYSIFAEQLKPIQNPNIELFELDRLKIEDNK